MITKWHSAARIYDNYILLPAVSDFDEPTEGKRVKNLYLELVSVLVCCSAVLVQLHKNQGTVHY